LSASTDVAAYEDLPGHHLLAARNLIATTNDESYHGSTSELPPATSHGYAEWDFSSVPDPVMFQRFPADYWFSYSNDSSAGIFDPACECFVVVVDDQANGTNVAGAGDREAPENLGTGVPQDRGPSAPPPHRRGALTSMHTWLKRASSRLSLRRNTARYDFFVPPLLEKLPRAAYARELGRQARERINIDFDVNNPNTPPRASQKLIAATTLLRDMPAPSTLEAQNLHREAQALIKQAAAQQAESSASRIYQQGSTRDDGGAQGPEASVHVGGAAGQPANHGRTSVRERILDTRG
jgi:hypothetical protein